MMKKIKEFIIKLLTYWEFDKNRRKKYRLYLNHISIRSHVDSLKYYLTKIPSNTVLICEPNDFHVEVVVGYAKYLIDMGYNVDIFISMESFRQNIFSQFHPQNIRIYTFSSTLISANNLKVKFKNFNKLQQYKFILFSSYTVIKFINYKNYVWQSIEQILDKKITKLKTFFVVHDINEIKQYNLYQHLEINRIITLGNFKYGVMINPHYFGNYSDLPPEVNINFIIVGGTDSNRRNYNILFSALNNLHNNNLKFCVTIIGKYLDLNIPKHLEKYINKIINPTFDILFKKMRSSKFILPLFDKNIEAHMRYITTGVSGTIQLSYGFNVPCIISNDFAEFYGFTEDNSIIYNNLEDALQLAISISDKEYNSKKNNLRYLADGIYKKSMANFINIIK